MSDTPITPNRFIRVVPLLPLRDVIVFPNMVVPLFVGRPKSIRALEEAMNNDKDILLAAQKKTKIETPTPEHIFRVGTLGTIIQLLRLPNNTVKVLIEGKRRAHIDSFLKNEEFFQVEVTELHDPPENLQTIEPLMRSVHSAFEAYVKLNDKLPPKLLMSISAIDDPAKLADSIVVHLKLDLWSKQEVLDARTAHERLKKLLEALRYSVEVLQIDKKIESNVNEQMKKTQREYYLNERMQAIQKELGDKDDGKNEIQELEERLAKKKMTKEAHEKVTYEIKKLKMMSPMSAEATVVRNYIDWLLGLPWKFFTDDKLNISEAESILEADHYGLRQPKERILEYLAVHALVEKIKGPILCLVGPPGVGKTSLAQSIARAMGRKFVCLSLGGVRDEAEIRGHRRTYIGALPGKILQSIRKAGSSNPVFLLDEIDKMSMDFRGDPSAALLEVLDPEQNATFNDHYLDCDYDLSHVMFITTANTLHAIPLPLQDRMEVIRIPGYTEFEKINIAKRYLIPKQLDANGLYKKNAEITDNAVKAIIRRYTREAGVRNLEREIATVFRKVAKDVVKEGRDYKERITSNSLYKYLGIPQFRYGKAETKDEVGLTNGLAWTGVGGELLVTEVSIMPGKGKLTLTGRLGDVMQESAQAAMSYVRSRALNLDLDLEFYQNVDIHIHVPEGAIPKDGPSAGITIATSIVSALINVPVKRDIAMTGEISLRGRVMPIGGLKEKIFAAHRAQIKAVIIPRDNKKDLRDIPRKILKEIEIIPAEHMDEVLMNALVHADPKKFETILKREDTRVWISKVKAQKDTATEQPPSQGTGLTTH